MADSYIRQATLSNGLQLIGEVNPDSKSCAIGFFVNTGARDETAQEAGISHFLEHMVFKGTDTRSALDITFQLGNIGAQANAYTSEETTVYYAAVVPEYFAQMQELLSDMLRPALEQSEFDTEKKVILEEIALYEDRPHFYLFEHAMLDYFNGHPAGNSVLGSVASVSAITRDMMQTYFDRRYSPSNMVLVATGNFSWEEFAERAEQQCGSWGPVEVSRDESPYSTNPVARTYRRKDLSLAHVLFVAEGASARSEHRFPLGLLSHIIGDARGSRIYWELIDKGLVDSAGADNDEKCGTGCFLAYASTEPERLDSVAEILRKILDTPLQFTAEDLERTKTKLITRIVLNGELPLGRLMSIGNEWLYRNRLHVLPEQLAELRAVEKRDIEAAVEAFGLNSWAEFRLIGE